MSLNNDVGHYREEEEEEKSIAHGRQVDGSPVWLDDVSVVHIRGFAEGEAVVADEVPVASVAGWVPGDEDVTHLLL